MLQFTSEKSRPDRPPYSQAEWDLRPTGTQPGEGMMFHRLVVVSRAYISDPYSSCSGESYQPLGTSLPPHTNMTPSIPVAVWKSRKIGDGPCKINHIKFSITKYNM